jgi:methylglutaconyl-CoA hydratase
VIDLLRGAPGALCAIKRLPYGGTDPATRTAMTSLLVERLASAEGREGLRAFLDKRPATWVPEGTESL